MSVTGATAGERHPWDEAFDKLRSQFPGTTDGVLFCIHKLQQDPGLALLDFRHEAELHGLRVNGAAYHSARVLLGLEKRREVRTRDGSNGWEDAESRLWKEFPGVTRGILFCVYKLRQDPRLRIPDFRGEAAAHGVTLGGRALHSARNLLGLEPEGSRARTQTAANGPEPSRLLGQLHETIQRLREEADAESERLREVMRRAIRVLEEAVEEE